MSWITGIYQATKVAIVIWKEVFKIMTQYPYMFKPTDALVRAQVTLFMLGINKKIEDTPDLYNLREAVMIAMGMTPPAEEPAEEQE